STRRTFPVRVTYSLGDACQLSFQPEISDRNPLSRLEVVQPVADQLLLVGSQGPPGPPAVAPRVSTSMPPTLGILSGTTVYFLGLLSCGKCVLHGQISN